MTVVLSIYAKAPVVGQVKSRLAASIGAQAALAAHETLVESTLAELAVIPKLATQLWLSEPHVRGEYWADKYGVELRIQPAGDLGQKMQGTFARLFYEGALKVILVGSDVPGINQQYIEQAVSSLAESPVVFGPTEDGGYGLIGLTAEAFDVTQAVFCGVPWSTDEVFSKSCAILEDKGCQWGTLDTVWDVDTESQWRRFIDLKLS